MPISACKLASQNRRASNLGESEMRKRDIDPGHVKKTREIFLLVVLNVVPVFEDTGHGLDKRD